MRHQDLGQGRVQAPGERNSGAWFLGTVVEAVVAGLLVGLVLKAPTGPTAV